MIYSTVSLNDHAGTTGVIPRSGELQQLWWALEKGDVGGPRISVEDFRDLLLGKEACTRHLRGYLPFSVDMFFSLGRHVNNRERLLILRRSFATFRSLGRDNGDMYCTAVVCSMHSWCVPFFIVLLFVAKATVFCAKVDETKDNQSFRS